MRLLFVKLKHIGDALLLTPTLQAVRQKYPRAEITVVVRQGTEGILKGCRAIDQIWLAAAPETSKRSKGGLIQDLSLLMRIRRTKFDYAFELTDGDRGRWLAGMSGAKKRCVNTSFYPLNVWWRLWFNTRSEKEWVRGHRVEKDYYAVSDILPIGAEPPALTFEKTLVVDWEKARSLSRYIVLHPGTRWKRKRWPLDRWIELGRWIIGKGFDVVVSAGPDSTEVQDAQSIVDQLGHASLSTQGSLSWAQLAGLLWNAKLFVGVDTAAMHLAAGCRVPIVALFGPSSVSQWRPWKSDCELIHPGGVAWDGVVNGEHLMNQITVSQVTKACDEFLAPGSRIDRLRHGD